MNILSTIYDTIRRYLSYNNMITKLIVINVIIFVAVGFVRLGFFLFGGLESLSGFEGSGFVKFWNNLSLSADSSFVITKPWTLVSYMFMHSGVFHILMNMLILFWFGSILRDFQGDNKVLSTYLLGGISGGLIYIVSYQLIHVHSNNIPGLGMVGASASVLAVLIAAATLTPDYRVNLLFVGPVKLKYIALVLVVLDFINLPYGNYGGHIAHLGGALYGFIFSRQLKKGVDIGAWLTKMLFTIKEAFKTSPKTKTNKKSDTKFKAYYGGKYQSSETKKESGTAQSIMDQEAIDKILDKIAKSGYESLSDKEKDILFSASKK